MGGMTSRLMRTVGWAAAGALAVAVVLAGANVVRGGPLDPPGPPNSTLQPLNQMPPDWYAALASNNGDGNGCGSSRFDCVMTSFACNPTCHFSIDGVLDHETGLVWQRDLSGALSSWEGAQSTCTNFTGGGTKGWRLPTAAEMLSLADPSMVTPAFALPAGAPFRTIPSGAIAFWTNTRDATNTQNIYTVRFRGSLVGDGPAASLTDVNTLSGAAHWCVRGADTAR